VRPLLFLVSHSFVNGVKRALGTPKRLITLVAFLGYYAWVATRSYTSPRTIPMPASRISLPHLQYSIIQILDALVFAVFMFLSMTLLIQLPSYNRTMTAADIDVLFPTPVSPRLVMFLRVVRDYLATLLIPLVIGIFTWRPISSAGFLVNVPHPETAGYVFRTAAYAWILLAMVWTVFGYATTLFVNRSDLASDRNAKILSLGTAGLVLSAAGYMTYQLAHSWSVPTMMALAGSPVLRITFFLAHLGSMFALGPLTGMQNTFVSGFAFLAMMAAGLAVALSQVGWMYDQAAVRGFETTESARLRRSGDMTAILADQARRGKLKSGRQTWLHRLRVRPWGAMIWREAVVQRRSFRGATLIIVISAIIYSLLPVALYRAPGSKVSAQLMVVGFMFLGCQVMGVFMFIMASSSNGYVELLRRIDLLKPLPFSPARLMAVEVFAKTFIPITVSLGCTVIALIGCAPLWPYALAHLMYGPSLAIMLSSSVLVVTLLFPDVDDGTQRGFRGLMQLLGIAVATAPGVSVFIGLTIVVPNHSPLPGAVIASMINVGVTIGLTIAAGYLYLGFNPTE